MREIPAALGLPADEVTNVLQTAGRAPSLHNTQPWRFRLTPTTIELHADPERRLTVLDPDGCEMRIACGAALFNLRLALHGLGIRPTVTVLPDPERPDLLAVVRNGGRKLATPDQLRLLRAVPLRRTNRHPFSEVPVDVQDQYALKRAATEEGAWLHIVADPRERSDIQRLAVRAHRTLVDEPAFHEELRRWTAVSPQRRDGVPVAAGGPQPAPHERWVLRDFSGGATGERLPGKGFEAEPAIAVLSSHLSGDVADIQAGQAMQHVLLTATERGLAVSFLSQLVEVPQVREELRRRIGGSRPPQVVLRIGRGWPVAATPRRDVADLLLPEPATPSCPR